MHTNGYWNFYCMITSCLIYVLLLLFLWDHTHSLILYTLLFWPQRLKLRSRWVFNEAVLMHEDRCAMAEIIFSFENPVALIHAFYFWEIFPRKIDLSSVVILSQVIGIPPLHITEFKTSTEKYPLIIYLYFSFCHISKWFKVTIMNYFSSSVLIFKFKMSRKIICFPLADFYCSFQSISQPVNVGCNICCFCI